MRSALYIRVSTEDQAKEGFSLPAQKRKLIEYCKVRDWTIISLYCDEGISAKNLKDRPKALKMLEDAKNGDFDNIVIIKVDRLCRNVKELLETVDLLISINVKLTVIDEQIEYTTPTGRAMLTMVGAFAEMERSMITARTCAGKEQKKLQGLRVCDGTAPYGYYYDNNTLKQSEKAEIVKTIFKLYHNGMSANSICFYLKDNNILNPTGTSNHWERCQVCRMLKNIVYKGYVKSNIKATNIDPIIEEGLFNQIQSVIEARAGEKRNVRKYAKDCFYFADVSYCAICGRKLVCKTESARRPGQNRRYYVCMYNQSKKLHKNDEGYHSSRMEKNVYEGMFLDFFDTFELDLTQKDVNVDTSRFDRDITNNRKKLEVLSKRKARLLEKYLDQTLSDDEYKLASNMIANDTIIIESSIEKLEEQKKNALEHSTNLEYMKTIANQKQILSQLWPYMSDHEKRLFISSTIKKITVVSRKIVSIEFK